MLHVGWVRDDGRTESVLHSAISADATTVSAPTTIFVNAGGGVNPSVVLVRAPDGSLRAFFAATNAFDGVLATAVSGDGAAWTVQGAASRTGAEAKPVYAASGIGAAVGTDGVFYSIWGDSVPGAGGLHTGLNPSALDSLLPGGLKRDPSIGVDSQTGQVVAAWSALDGSGVVTLALGGAPVAIPRSEPQRHRVAISGRVGAAGVFVAYTRRSKPALYRVDSGRSRRLSRANAAQVSIAAAPDGRLWVIWKRGGTIYATRSNPAATRWGRIVSVRAPQRSRTIYDVAGDATAEALDVVALVHTGEVASWHRRLQPGLTLSRRKGKRGRTVLVVSDAGAPVAGAKVTLDGKRTKTTGGTGRVSFRLRRGRHRARASSNGYAGESLSFGVSGPGASTSKRE